MHIDIYSDTICPWCYIGKRRLETALATRPDLEVTIRWRAFQLNPDMPPEGMDRRQYLETKFDGSANADQVYSAVRAAGEEEGIPFDFRAIARTPNTLDSHRLLRFSEAAGLQTALVEELFQAYFLRGEDIGDHAVLLQAATAAGLDTAETRAFLASDAEAQEIRAEDLRARMAGITGVPCFIFNGRYALPGAQPAAVLLQMFDLAREEQAAEPAGA